MFGGIPVLGKQRNIALSFSIVSNCMSYPSGVTTIVIAKSKLRKRKRIA
jgi:hypothetical protein